MIRFTVVLSCVSASASAQQWQLEAGVVGARYDSTEWIASASLAPQVSWGGRGVRGVLGGNLASLSSQWSTQGRGEVSMVFGPARDGLGVGAGIVGSLAGSAHSNGYRTGTTRAEARVLHAARWTGAWGGMTASSGWSSTGTGSVRGWAPGAGVWATGRRWSVAAAGSSLRISGSWFPEVNAQASTTIGRLQVTGYAGWRGAPTASGVMSARWVGASALVRISPSLGITAGGGSYPSDLVQNLPGGRFLSFSLRFSSRPPGFPMRASGQTVAYVVDTGERELRFSVPQATRVELAGDWNGWQRIPMHRAADGKWVVRVKLPSGVHRFNVIADGDRWLVPEEVASLDDGMGGRAGLLVVP